MIKSSVLFLRTGNSRRTQMAEGLLRDISGQEPKAVNRFLGVRRVRDEIQRHLTDFVRNNGITKGTEQRHEPRGEGAST